MMKQLREKWNSNRKVKYANDLELVKIEKKIQLKLTNYRKHYDKLSSRYIKLAKRKQETNKGNIKKIIKLSKKVQRANNKIQKQEYELSLVKDKKYIKHSLFYKIRKGFSSIPYTKQKVIWGAVFITPWALGFLILFLPAVLKSFWWSFNEVTPDGTVIKIAFVGIQKYIYLFTEHVIDGSNIFNAQIYLFVMNLGIDLPIILIFSLFVAVLLNTQFKGHRFVKAVFFIPVIYNIAIITTTLKGFGQYLDENTTTNLLLTTQLSSFLMEIGVGGSFIDIVISAVERIFTIVNYSGIQILIFIAALQSIPNQLYEAAKVEGATKYETFWKITFPMVTPMLLTSAIYTIIDSFTRAPIYRFLTYAIVDSDYGLASAIAMSYFVINLLIILIVFGLLKGLVFYHDERK